jgi:hypothetical protein
MMRLFSSLLAGLATFAFAATASAALGVQVSPDADTLALAPGQELTLTITLTTTNPGEARGLTLRAAGLDGNLSFVSATIPNFGGVATPNGAIFGNDLGGGVVIAGLNSILAGPVDNGTNVVLFDGVTTSATFSAGPEVFTLTLQAIGGAGTLEIGAIGSFGDAYVSSVDGTSAPTTTLAYSVVPEPGTALLMGLGLAGLAAAGRRE